MNQPSRRGTAVSPERIKQWLGRFRFYRHPPDENSIDEWLKRFSLKDRDLAARVLDCVEVVAEQTILRGYNNALNRLDGWHKDPKRRRGRWFFIGFGRSGESGQAMLRYFREANKLTRSEYDDLFKNATDIPFLELSAADTVVFVDDFSGTGRQISVVWPTMLELLAAESRCYLVLSAATTAALGVIRELENLQVRVDRVLEEGDNVFKCSHFSAAERDALEQYGRKADSRHPKGFGDCGLLFVLSHKTPNNTLPILHAYNKKWKGLFPRTLPLEG